MKFEIQESDFSILLVSSFSPRVLCAFYDFFSKIINCSGSEKHSLSIAVANRERKRPAKLKGREILTWPVDYARGSQQTKLIGTAISKFSLRS